jgi:hypothetical protein
VFSLNSQGYAHRFSRLPHESSIPLDEAVEVQMLILDRYRSLNSNRWKMAIVGTLISGLIAGAGTRMLLSDLYWPLDIAAGVVAGLLGGINCYLTYQKMVIRNLRKICRE